MDNFINQLPNSSSKRKNRLNNGSNPRSSSHGSSSKVQKQMYLDFGQRSFNKSVNCKKCSMTYVPSDADDLLRHKKHCINTQDCLCSLPAHYIETTDFTSIGEGPTSLNKSKVIVLRKHKLKSEFL